MKLLKKIAAIMLSIMMVLGMASVVSADGTTSGTSATTKGKITINSAVAGQTYKIYKLLDLESYDATNKLYSYKPVAEWETFFKTGGEGSSYVDVNDKNGYVTWNANVDESKAAELAQKALKYATDNSASIKVAGTQDASNNTVVFENLDLGYYLIDSSLGALCGLTTTNNEVTITEKNGVPTVDKKIEIGTNPEQLVEKNSVNLGESVIFKTTINVQPGVKNYVLYDKIDSYFDKPVILHIDDNAENKINYVANTDFKCTYAQTAEEKNKYTFKIEFLDNFYQTRAEQINAKKITTITIYYSATVKADAPIKTAMNNKTWLTYGDKNTESNKSETNTYTFGIPVFKHTGTGASKQALAGAEFKLYTDVKCVDDKALKFTKNTDNKYRYNEATGDVTLTSLADGFINIEGIKEGTYYLKETKAPAGYNLLDKVITIIVAADGKITVDGTELTRIDVQNVSGSLLPSTGGMGTTVIYIAGALLVLISGVVLITKKRTDLK